MSKVATAALNIKLGLGTRLVRPLLLVTGQWDNDQLPAFVALYHEKENLFLAV